MRNTTPAENKNVLQEVTSPDFTMRVANPYQGTEAFEPYEQPNYSDASSIIASHASSARAMAYGVGGAQYQAMMNAQNSAMKIQRILSQTVIKARFGVPVPQAPRATNNSTQFVPYPTKVSVTRTTPTINSRSFTQLAVTFSRPPDQRLYTNARIYVNGYRGNPNWVMLAEPIQSPWIGLFETSGETVRIAVASRSSTGQINDVTKAPTTAVVL